jgi:circadian clock protein KaiB
MTEGQERTPAQGAPADGKQVLWLFVAGDGPNSLQARKNLAQICEEYLQGRCEIATFDVFQDFQLAREHGVVVTPTLIRVSPLPRVMLVGTLRDTPTVLTALGLRR